MHYCFITIGEWGPTPNIGYVLRRDLGNAMARQGVQVTFVLDDLPGNHVDLKFEPGVRVAYVPNPKSLSQLKHRRRVLREVAPDFVQILIQSAKAWLAVVGQKSIPVVSEWDEWPNPAITFSQKILAAVRAAWLRKHAVLHLVTTHDAQELYKQRWNLSTLHLPFAAYLTPHNDDGPSPFAAPTALYVGNFHPQWDHEIILNAAQSLAQRGKFPEITLLGDGPDLAKWRQWVQDKKLTNVHLPGFTSGQALWQHMRHAHVLLFPVRDALINRVRCPSKTFAYMQAGRPIITNRVGEIPYLLGDIATYIPQGTQAFADAIDTAITTGRQPDLDYHSENHTWDSRATLLIEALRNLPPNRFAE
jgi:glycosyltransferase involved in cell wall biosynthesis